MTIPAEYPQNDRYIDHEHRITRLESSFDNNTQILLRVEKKLDKLEDKLDKLEDKTDSNFKFLVRMIITNYILMTAGFASVLGVIAHIHRWIA